MTAARWPVGTGLTAWRYLWRTTPLSRRELGGRLDDHRAPELPPDFDREGLQRPRDGAGPMFHRVYRIRMRDSALSAAELLSAVANDPNTFAPAEFASFQKADDDDHTSRASEEYVVRMPGPWDGPVRVVEAHDSCIRLATLEGHLEAGQIEFRASEEDGLLTFTIESWARSSSRLADLLYDRMRMSKEIQAHMWVSFLEGVLKHAGARRVGCVDIHTRRVDEPPPTTGRELVSEPRIRRRLERLREAPLNFDPAKIVSEPDLWQYDERLQRLPPEPPGTPVPEGSWEMARRLMRGYEFSDPSIVRAFYDPAVPLERRNMLLEVRFHGLRLRVGCRVAGVYERVEEVEGRDAALWGWSYRTLQGHFEQGEMHWQVLKWLDSGEVAFRIRAWSRRARDANPILRLGFRLFGRREQVRFYDSTCERMLRLTEEAIRPGATGETVRGVSEAVMARATRDADPVGDLLARNVDRERRRDG